LESRGLINKDTVDLIDDKNKLKDGEVFMMLKDVVEALTDTRF